MSGNYNFTVRVTDFNGASDDQSLTLRINDAPVILTTTFPQGTVGAPYSQVPATSGGTTPFTWSLISGTLPSGIGLNTSTGQISGTPTAEETAVFIVRVTDTNGVSDDQELTLVINPPPVITTTTLPDGTAGALYSSVLTATGGTTPLTWTVAGGSLPPGLSLSSTGTISGTPTTAGTYGFTVTVTDSNNVSDGQILSILINPVPVITTTTLPDGIVGNSYSATLTATGGTSPLTWQIISGSLPAGLSLNSATGVISGTPMTSDIYNFTAQVMDINGVTDTQPLSITIRPFPPTGLTVVDVPNDFGGQVDLSWNPSPDTNTAGYNVYRSRTLGGPYTLLNTTGLVTATTYRDTCLANNTTYYYVVTSVNTAGLESAYSNEASGAAINNLSFADLTLNGVNPSDNAGYAVANQGDLNGDGLADLVVGAIGASPSGRTAAGEVYINLSTACQGGAQELGSASVVIRGQASLDLMGASVASAKDLSGDGIADLVIGVPGADPGGRGNAGSVYIFFGRSTWPSVIDLSVDSPDVTINGVASGDELGAYVANSGDVNGDTRPDLIIGAPNADAQGIFEAGAAYIVFGRATFPATMELSISANVTLMGGEALALAGRVTNGGDVNGDGLADILVGAPGVDGSSGANSGATYLVLGRTNWPKSLFLSISSDAIFYGANRDDQSGVAVSNGGDVNRDGYEDILIGAALASPGGKQFAGTSYLIFGRLSFSGTMNLNQANVTINGIATGDQSGRSLDISGDANGDGFADIVIGAFNATPDGQSAAGQVYVVYGSPIFPTTMGLDTAALTFDGEAAFDNFGFSVSSMGDINGDAKADIFIGANLADTSGRVDAGQTYVVSAPSAVSDSTQPSIPIGLSATPGVSQVNLAWTASTDNVGGAGIAGYRIYRDSVLVGLSVTTGYIDTGLIPSTTYTYTVTAVDRAGNESAPSSPVSTTTLADTIPPTIPTNLTTTVLCPPTTPDIEILLTWTASTDNVGILGYKIYRNSDVEPYAIIGNFTSFIDRGLVPNTLYNYRVSAIDLAGNESPLSVRVSASTCADTGIPSVPTNLTATVVSSSQIDLNWSPSTDNDAVRGYKIYRDGILVHTLFTNTTSYSNTGLAAGTAYAYTVSAFDFVGNESAQSAPPVSATTYTVSAPPSAPTNLSVTPLTETQMSLSWTASTDDVGVLGYRIERSLNGSNFTEISVTTGTGTTYSDSGLQAGTRYYYRARAYDASNNFSGYSNVADAITADITPPSIPTNFSATAVGETTIVLLWRASTDNAGVAGYEVERCQGAGCTNFIQIATPTVNLYVNSGLSVGQTYSYRVRAYDAANNLSSYSSVATDTTLDVTAPTVPTGLSATGVSETQINLSWTASSDNVGIAGYRIERSLNGVTFTEVAVTTAATTYPDTGLSAGTRYYYRVRAYDAAGNLGNYSSTVNTLTLDVTPPSDPINLSANAVGSTTIVLLWTPSTDNAGVAGYQVERCQGAGCTNFAQIATPTVNLYVNSGLSVGQTYSYRVRAYDAANNLSGYSNVASATTIDVTFPSTPTGLSAVTVSQSQINLSWTASTDDIGIAGYKIERSQDGTNFTQIAQTTTTATNYPDTALAQGTLYYYRVRAYDAAGNNSAYSNTDSTSTFSALTFPTSSGLVTVSSNGGRVATGTEVNTTTLPPNPGVSFPYGVVSFTIDSLPLGQTVIITLTLPGPVSTTSQYWKYGKEPLNLTDHWYTIPFGSNDGDNIITLTITDGASGDNDLTADGTITDPGGPTIPNQSPTASFTANPTNGVAPLVVNFDASASSDTDGTIVNYSWDYGDGTTGSGVTTSHTFTADGPYTAVLTVTDNRGAVGTTQQLITVGANVAPVANAQSVTTPEDTAVIITLTGSDAEGSSLAFSIVTPPTHGTLGAITPLNATSAQVTYTPNTNYNGSDGFTFRVNDGIQNSAAATVTITITAVNDLPIANSQTVTTNEDMADTIILTGSDLDGDSLSFSIVTPPTHGILGSIIPANSTSALVSYTPVANYNGPDSFTFRVNDGTVNSSDATITITVNSVNDPPVASFTATPPSGPAPLAVSFNASASSDVDGTISTYAWNFGDGNFGSGITVSHTYNATGNYTAVLTVTDNLGANGTHQVTISVRNNTAPVANTQSQTALEDDPIVITLTGSDADGDSLTFSITTQPTQGSLGPITQVSPTSANVTYTPSANYNGSDSFNFRVNDGQLNSNPAPVLITVTAVNDVPVADSQSVTTPQDTAITIILEGSDADGDSLTFSVVTTPVYGTLGPLTQISPTSAQVTYTPNANFDGTDSFSFRVSDGVLNSNPSTVSVNVSPVLVAFNQSSSNGLESVTPVSLAVSLSLASGQTVSVDYVVVGGSATGGGVDYTLADGTLTFAPGVTTQNIVITVVNDTLNETSETIQVMLSTPVHATLGAITVHTYSITDNDGPPTVEFSVANSSGLESVTPTNLAVSLSSSSGQTVSVNYAVTGGTATGGGVDYTLASGTLTFNPGVMTQNIGITVINDTLSEANETIQVALSGPVNATLGANTVHTYTITDNDPVPTVAFSVTSSSDAESTTPANLSVALSATSGQTVTVNYAVTGGTATGGGVDYTLAAGTLTFAPGVVTQNIAITIVNDTADEVNETVQVTLSAPVNATLGANTVHTYTITDNDGPTVAFSVTSSSGLESVTPANLAVALSASSPQTVTVNYTVTGGTATGGGVDYTLTAGTLTFNPGVTTQNIAIAIVNDTLSEAGETIQVTLSAPVNATLGANTVHTYTITDNDGPAVAFSVTSSSGLESVTPANLAVALSASSPQTVTVNYAVTGGTATGGGVDYTLAAGTLTFAPGVVTQNIAITIVNDTADEVNETVQVTLSAPANATLGANTVHTYTITDNDGPAVAFSVTSSSGLESVTPANLAVALSASSPQTVTVNYTVTGGTATGGGVDYTLAAGTLTFNPGVTTQNVAIAIVDDTLSEGGETVQVILSAPVNAALGANTVHTYTITDNDGAPTVAFSANTSSGLESVSPANLAVALSASSGQTITVNYAVSGGTATGGGVDYTLANGTLTFVPGATTQNIAITIINDTLDEADETVQVTLSAPVNAALGANTVHTYTITDNDGAPTVAFSANTSSGLESVSPANLAVALSAASGQTVTVNYAVSGGTATGGGVDYTLASGTLTFVPGATTQNIAITIINDTLDEPDETVQVTLSAPVNATLGANTVHTYTITDNDGTPTVAFSVTSSSGAESVTPANLAVALSASSGQTVTVNYAVTGGTATGGGVDYTLASGTLTFNPGTTTQNIAIAIVDDTLNEGNETVQVTLSAPLNATLGANTVHTYTITDNDGPAVAFSVTSSSGLESATPANLAVALSAASGQTVTVNYAVTGGTATGGGVDYTLASGTLTFVPGATTQNIAITIINDTLDEVDETVQVTLSAPVNATLGTNTVHTYTITDNDGPTVAFSVTSSSGLESVTPANLAVALSAASGQTVTVNYAVSGGTATGGGVDYTLASGTLTFNPGVTTQNIAITVINDTIDEANETIQVTLSAPVNATLGANTVHTYTITDNDTAPTVAFSVTSSSGAEPVTPANLAVALSATSGQTVTVNYAVTGGTATGSGVDYTLASGTLTFAPGTTTQNVAIAIVNDALNEANETIQVTLSAPANATLGANAVHTYTITDNDAVPTVAFSVTSSSGLESVTPANLAVALSSASGQTVTVNYAVTGGTAAGGGVDYTLASGTLTLAPGVVTQNIAITIVNDALDEADETVQVTLSAPVNAILGANTVHTYTITDNDGPTVAFSVTSSSGSESITPANLAVALSASSGQTVTVNYAVTGGTATGGGVDYTLAAGTLTFNPGITTQNIAITIVNDTLSEVNETIQVTLSAPANATLGANTVHTYTITDDDSIRQIIKGTGVTGTGATTVINFTSGTGGVPLLDLTKAFHVISYRHTAENQHDQTFKSSAITSTTQLTIYGRSSGGNNPVNFEYTIIEFASANPTVVQRRTLNTPANSTFPRTDTLPTAVNLAETMIVNQGHTHTGAGDTTIGNEEFDRIRLLTTTSWEFDVGGVPNSGPQDNRVEVIDWDPAIVSNAQRGLSPMGGTATTLTITPPTAVDRTRTLLFVSARTGTGSSTTMPPSQVGLFATINASGQIVIEREATGPQLLIAWEVIEFDPGVMSVQHLTINLAAGQTTTTATIPSVNLSRSLAFGTVSVPFGHGGARASTTTGGAIDRNQFTVGLDNSTTARVTRGDGTGTAKIGVQVWTLP
jgi:fibronectin type 3 domain-containing protein